MNDLQYNKIGFYKFFFKGTSAFDPKTLETLAITGFKHFSLNCIKRNAHKPHGYWVCRCFRFLIDKS